MFPRLIIAVWIFIWLGQVPTSLASEKPGAYSKLPAEQTIAQLLEAPAPPVDWREYLRQHPRQQKVPGADAPLDEFLEYWRYAPDNSSPDPQTQQRLLEVCEHDPDELVYFIRFFAKSQVELHDRLKKIYDRVSAIHTERASELTRHLHDWLMKHTRFFRDEFITRLFPARDDKRFSWTENELETLINLDRESARKHLLEQSRGADESDRIYALSLLFEYLGADDKESEEWRNALCQTATNLSKPLDLREKAVFGAMKRKWAGQEQWFVKRFEDRQMLHQGKPAENNALARCVARDPDRLIGIVAPLVSAGNATVRDNAVQCLIQFDNAENARADALRPLLPWLENKQWARDVSGSERSSLFGALMVTQLPECVPHLIKCINRENGAEFENALKALVHYQARDAVAPMRKRLERERNDEYRTALMSAMFQLNGLKSVEIADCLKRYVEKIVDKLEEWSGGDYYVWSELDKHGLDWRVEVGYEIASSAVGNDAAANVVLDLAQQEESTNPIASEHLYCLAVKWPTPIRKRAIIERLKAGTFSPIWIDTVIDKRSELDQILREASDLHGSARGIQASLSADRRSIEDVLKSNDTAAQTALFACARLARVSLPLDLAIHLLDSKERSLAAAADKYFAESDSPIARAEIRKRASNQARVVGTQLNFSAFPMEQGEISRTEKELKRFFHEPNPPREIYALLSEGNFGSDGQRALFVYDERNVLRCSDGNGRMREREVSKAEFTTMRDWINKNNVADLPPYNEGAMDGIQLQYVHAAPDTGERVFMNNPPGGPMGAAKVQPGITEPRPDPIVYAELTRRMLKLNEVPMTVVYPKLKKLEGYRVVHAKEDGEISSLRFRNGQLYAGVSVSYDKPLEWRLVKRDQLSDQFEMEATDPLERKFYPDYLDWEDRAANVHEGKYAGKRLWPGTRQKDKVDALWASETQGEPELIVRGEFYKPLICPGDEWLIAAKSNGHGWAEPNGIVRIHLPDKKMFDVDLPAADNFDWVAWIEAKKRVLLYRQRDPEGKAGPEKPEFYLLDPVTGAHEKVEGEMRPFFDAGRHELQPTGKPNEFWAALHSSVVDPKLTTTAIGRFDSYNFRFTPVLEFPDMHFESASFYVDKETKIIWLAVNGDLLGFSSPD
ncbi:MAG TPA: hypothetical protein VEP30_07935 [Chthoniobacterales bacterium]|nr:hypothetical protein [Chthoniobacterales bacterium]